MIIIVGVKGYRTIGDIFGTPLEVQWSSVCILFMSDIFDEQKIAFRKSA